MVTTLDSNNRLVYVGGCIECGESIYIYILLLDIFKSFKIYKDFYSLKDNTKQCLECPL